ncbi:MAG: hypothetical protein WCO04_12815, partial [Pseudomonadota bacterium]
MTQAGQRVCDVIRLFGAIALGLSLGLVSPVFAQVSGGSAGGTSAQAPVIAADAPVSGGFAPQSGAAKPKAAVSGGASGG